MIVTDEEIEQYSINGAICLRGIFGRDWIEKVARGVESNLQDPSVHAERLVDNGELDGGAYFNDYCNWKKIPEFKKFVYSSPAAAIAGQLMKSEWSTFYHEHVLVKEAGALKKTPWHQDQSYYPIDGFKVCSIWMPLDEVEIDSTIQFVAGSHAWSRWFRPRKFATSKNYPTEYPDVPGRVYEDVPDFDSSRYKILKWHVKPGDCIVFHMKTLHEASGNKSAVRSRRIFSTRWLGDDAVIAKRPWQTSPPTTGGLHPGEPVFSEEFPIVWRRK